MRRAPERLGREAFFEKTARFDADALRKILWNLYWRAAAPVRARIEDALEPERERTTATKDQAPLDGEFVLDEVRDFVDLARRGAYIAGTREVSRKERTRWRFRFKDLVRDAARATEGGDLDNGAVALELLISLACETNGRDYFHSEDPVGAMKLVVSDEVRRLWSAYVRHGGFARFVASAPTQLVLWERAYGWTRTGMTSLCRSETSLASVAAELLRGHDAWVEFTDGYLAALDALAPPPEPELRSKRSRPASASSDVWHGRYVRKERARNLAKWHGLLLDRLHGTDGEDRLERLVTRLALAGPELTFVEARLRALQGDAKKARLLAAECLKELPGHRGFFEFAREIGAEIPKKTEERFKQQYENAG